MVKIERRNAVKAFYYLMAADGEVCGGELERFAEIAGELDGESFADYKDALIEECKAQIARAVTEDEAYDVVQEGLDEALVGGMSETLDGIPVRLLVWDMLAIAFTDDAYSELERKLILHVVRTLKMDRSVFMEMEQLIKTAASVDKVLAWIKTTDRSYAEVSPVVEELEKRRAVIVGSAKALIEDEVEETEIYIARPELLDKAKVRFAEIVDPLAAELGERAKKTADDTKKFVSEKIAPAASDFIDNAGKLLGKLKSKKKGGAQSAAPVEDEADGSATE